MTTYFPAFVSVVLVVRNQSGQLASLLEDAIGKIQSLASDFELIVVDNASADGSIGVLQGLAGPDGLPNLQVYALTKEVDADTACWVGLENALGDFVAVLDPMADDIGFLPTMLDAAVGGSDVVFASNRQRPRQTFAYRMASGCFNLLYRLLGGIRLDKEAPQYRLLSRRVVNFLQQHRHPATTYRLLPATAGFARANLDYSATARGTESKRLGDGIERGTRLLLTTTRAPMRIVTALSLFGALANLAYSGYVLAIAAFKADVAPGWVSLSLQQSGMFLLISLVLLVLGEYILNMATLTSEGPRYHVGQEFTSARLIRRERLNVEEPRTGVPEL
jgi:glycosyltransferase involved in cell wall biosynthesis